MNDVVLLPVVVLSMLLLGGAGEAANEVTRAEISRHAIGLFVLGPALGAIVGWLGIVALIRIRSSIGVRRDYESLYALGLAFTGYAAAESVGGSGFLAAFAAGFMVAWQDVELCDCFLEYGEATAEMLLLLTFVAFGTSVIWFGLTVIGVRTLIFAAAALFIRTIVLYPLLAGVGLNQRERKLIALFGPRGLSSLLFALLPVFAGVAGAEQMFALVSLVVLLSILIHGIGVLVFMRVAPKRTARRPPLPVAEPAIPAAQPAAAGESEVAEFITLPEVKARLARGDAITIADARAERSYHADNLQARGAVRIDPDDPVRSAAEQRLSQQGTLVVYCA
jgi:NhaP-type Na+/H+ or K+/H+ antiporter